MAFFLKTKQILVLPYTESFLTFCLLKNMCCPYYPQIFFSFPFLFCKKDDLVIQSAILEKP